MIKLRRGLAIAALVAALVKALERRGVTDSDFKSDFKDALDEVSREIRNNRTSATVPLETLQWTSELLK
jgi:hypothetical protein